MNRTLITGASGQLGCYLLRELQGRSGEVIAWSGSKRGDLFGHVLRPIDLTDSAAITVAFTEARPDVVLHAAAMARVADCFADPEKARRINTTATATLAELSACYGARFVFVSTDLVFNGERGHYDEQDPVSPLSIYGQSKAAAEAAVLTAPRAVVARISLLYGPSLMGRPGFFDEQLAALHGGRPVSLFVDEYRTPLDLATAARALLALAASDYTGILHIGGPERMSRLEMGLRLAKSLGLSGDGFIARRRDQAPAPEPRPRDVSLDSSLWRKNFPSLAWPSFEEALRGMGLITP